MRLFRSLIVYSSPTKKPTASYNAIGKKFLFQPGRQTGYVWQDNTEFVFTEYVFSVIVSSAVQQIKRFSYVAEIILSGIIPARIIVLSPSQK